MTSGDDDALSSFQPDGSTVRIGTPDARKVADVVHAQSRLQPDGSAVRIGAPEARKVADVVHAQSRLMSMDPVGCPHWIEPSNAFRVVLIVGKYTADVEYGGLVEMVEQEHELWLDWSIGYSLAQFYEFVATKITWGPSQTLSIWTLDTDTGSKWKIGSDDQWQVMMEDKWDERVAHIVVEVVAKDGYERNDSSMASKVSITGIPPRSSVTNLDACHARPNEKGTFDTASTSQPQHVHETVPYLLPHPTAMESMKNKAKGTTPPPSPTTDSADGDDRISALDDDLRELILRLAHLNVRELVRTSVLSKQWRGLWKRLLVLDFFGLPELESISNIRQYIAIVNDVLEQRAGATSEACIEELKIPLLLDVPEAHTDNTSSLYGQRQQLLTLATEAAEAWIWYAMHHQVKCFEFKFRLLPLDKKTHVMDLELLPSSPKLERMHLWFSCIEVRLPRTAVFTSLKDLTLEFVELAAGSGHLFARLLSSVGCPSLQKLRMMHVNFECARTKELVLDNNELLELSMTGVDGMELLEVRTPKLLYLEIDECYLQSLRVLAPGLKDITCIFNTTFIHGHFPHVWCLKIDLITHEEEYDDDDDDDDDDGNLNYCTICLLKRCSSSVKCLFVDLYIPLEYGQGNDLIKDKIPQVPSVTSLLISIVVLRDHHSFGDGVAALLGNFKNLEYLSLELARAPDICCKKNITCNHSGHWESRDISLANLRKADFKGINGTCCELRFLLFVLTSATNLQSVTLSFNRYNPEVEVQDSRMEYFRRKLLGEGTWTACEDEDVYNRFKSYEWTPSP